MSFGYAVRLLIACLLAPLAPLIAFYVLSLVMDGPAPILAAEPARLAFNAVPALILAYPWAWLIGTPPLVWLRRRGGPSWPLTVVVGLAAGAVPALIGAARSDALEPLPAALVFGSFGIVFALAFRALAGSASRRLR